MDNADWDELWRARVAERRATEKQARLQGGGPGSGPAAAPTGSSRRWDDAIVTGLIGIVVCYVATVVFVFATLMLVATNVLTGPDDLMAPRTLSIIALPFLLAMAVSVAAEAAYLRHRGMAPAWAAPIVATVVAELVCWPVALVLGLPAALGFVLIGIVQVLVLGGMIHPER